MLLRQYGAECQSAIYAWRDALKKRNADADADAYASAYADAYANAYADADADADAYAYAYTNAYASAYAYASALRADLFDAGIRFLDRALPPAQPVSDAVIARAAKLMEIAA